MQMKKSILLWAMIGVTLLLTSCLEEGSRNYDETSVVYMSTDITTGRVYGRTLTSKIITSANMQLMLPGTFQFLRYSWTEEYGTTPITLGTTSTVVIQADNVAIVGEPMEIGRVSLRMNQTPPQTETPDKFVAIDSPVYAEDKIYLGDHWLFQYAYEAKKGEDADVNFYYEGNEGALGNEATIIIDLTITGEPEAGSSTTAKTDIVALNMSQLRSLYESSGTTDTKELKVTFKYYRKGGDQLVSLGTYTMKINQD